MASFFRRNYETAKSGTVHYLDFGELVKEDDGHQIKLMCSTHADDDLFGIHELFEFADVFRKKVKAN